MKEFSLCQIIFVPSAQVQANCAGPEFVDPLDVDVYETGVSVETTDKADPEKRVNYFYPMSQIARVKLVHAAEKQVN